MGMEDEGGAEIEIRVTEAPKCCLTCRHMGKYPIMPSEFVLGHVVCPEMLSTFLFYDYDSDGEGILYGFRLMAQRVCELWELCDEPRASIAPKMIPCEVIEAGAAEGEEHA